MPERTPQSTRKCCAPRPDIRRDIKEYRKNPLVSLCTKGAFCGSEAGIPRLCSTRVFEASEEADRRNIQSGPERRARKGRGVVDAARSGTGTTDAHERGKNILDDVEIKKYLRRRIAAGAEHPIVDALAARCGKGRTRVHGLYHYNCISDVRAAETYA